MGAGTLGTNTYTAGTEVSAGLPNITGFTYSQQMSNNGYDDSGALFRENRQVANSAYGAGSSQYWSMWFLSFDASRSNTIYGNSDTVQPPAYIVYMWERVS